MEEEILTLHPQGKKGVNLTNAKYETMRKTILEVLRRTGLTHDELAAAANRKLNGSSMARFLGTWKG